MNVCEAPCAKELMTLQPDWAAGWESTAGNAAELNILLKEMKLLLLTYTRHNLCKRAVSLHSVLCKESKGYGQNRGAFNGNGAAKAADDIVLVGE